MSHEIPFTQYLVPDGRRKNVTFPVSQGVAAKAQEIVDYGWRFECEILTTGEVSLTVFDPVEAEDKAIEVIPNGPGMREAVLRLVTSGCKAMSDHGRPALGKTGGEEA